VLHVQLCLRKDEREFVGTVYHKVSRRLETAVQMEWTAGSNDTRFAIAAKYCPDMDTTLRVSRALLTRLLKCVYIEFNALMRLRLLHVCVRRIVN